MDGITLAQLRTLQAVVAEGSLQAAGERLGRTHPAVQTSVKALEAQLGFPLFDRGGYRLTLTASGRAFHDRACALLARHGELVAYANQLGAGQEAELRVIIGDLTPLPETLNLLRNHFDGFRQTRLHLQFEAIAGPWERLASGDADLILHHVAAGEIRFETIPLRKVSLIPVAAPGFFPASGRHLTTDHLRDATQCIIRDTAHERPTPGFYLVEGARTCTVSDQLMKHTVIVQGLGWGHMPDFLVESDLRTGRLVSLVGPLLRGGAVELVAARLAGRTHGPVAAALWKKLRETRQDLTGDRSVS